MEPWLMDKHVDVVVVGAGPVGLLLAIELTLGGANVMVLERLTAPNLGIKAPSVGPLGAEALERRAWARNSPRRKIAPSRRWDRRA